MKIIQFEGFGGRYITAEYYNKNRSNDLILFFPGMRYGGNHPIHYFLKKFLQRISIDYVFMEYNWSDAKENFAGTDEEIIQRINNEIETGISIVEKIHFDHLHVFGKSLGTLALEYLTSIETGLAQKIKSYFWLTPFTNTTNLPNLNLGSRENHYFYVGTGDLFYQTAIYDHLSKHALVRRFQDLDHSFEKANDIIGSIDGVKVVLENLIKDIGDVIESIGAV